MRHLTYANVASTAALVLALSGTAYATATITGADVVNGSLTGRDVGGNSIKSADVAGLSVLDFAANGLPGAKMEAAMTPDVPDGPSAAYPMDTEAYDTGNMYTAPNDHITIRKTGTYLINAGVMWKDADENTQVRVVQNGTVVALADAVIPAAGSSQDVTALLRLTAGDQLTLGTYTATGPVAVSEFSGLREVWLSAQMVSR